MMATKHYDEQREEQHKKRWNGDAYFRVGGVILDVVCIGRESKFVTPKKVYI